MAIEVAGKGGQMSMHRDDDPAAAQPEPDELELTDNSTGAAVDSNRLEEAEEETREQTEQ